MRLGLIPIVLILIIISSIAIIGFLAPKILILAFVMSTVLALSIFIMLEHTVPDKSGRTRRGR